MVTRVGPGPDRPGEAWVIGRIVLGALAGMAGGALAGALAFGSLVVALFAGLGGAVFGMLGPARRAEGAAADCDFAG
jgi:hypothetical protein